MKININEENWVKKPGGSSYNYAFKSNIEILVDIPGVTLSDEEYSKVRKAINSIRITLADVRRKAAAELKNGGKE